MKIFKLLLTFFFIFLFSSFNLNDDSFDRNSDIHSLVLKQYPNAVNYRDFIVEYLHEINKDYNVKISNIAYAVSSCSDEINRQIYSISILSSKFVLGGIAGYPHTGLTGLNAFAHHISNEQTAFIFFGPHIGITDKGELGKVLRQNQKHYSSSCGAIMLALEKFQKDKDYKPNLSNYEDFQQMILEEKLSKYKHRFLNSKNPKQQITEVAYEIIEKEIYQLIDKTKNEFNIKKIILLGGIVINTSPYFDDYIYVKHKNVINL